MSKTKTHVTNSRLFYENSNLNEVCFFFPKSDNSRDLIVDVTFDGDVLLTLDHFEKLRVRAFHRLKNQRLRTCVYKNFPSTRNAIEIHQIRLENTSALLENTWILVIIRVSISRKSSISLGYSGLRYISRQPWGPFGLALRSKLLQAEFPQEYPAQIAGFVTCLSSGGPLQQGAIFWQFVIFKRFKKRFLTFGR